jgi:hypothetical protein
MIMKLDPHPSLHNYTFFLTLGQALLSIKKKLAATVTNKKLQVQEKELVMPTLISKYYWFILASVTVSNLPFVF